MHSIKLKYTPTWREGNVKDMLSKVGPLLSIINAVEPIDISFVDTLDIPVHLTLRPCRLGLVDFDILKEWGHLDFSYVHSGKGLSPEQSRLSCIMEAIERYTASYTPVQGRIRIGTYNELTPEALDPRAFYMPDGVEYSEGKELTWYYAKDIISGRPVSVPIDFVLMDIPDSAYPFQGFETRRLGFFFSNGLAAGGTLDEAIISATCEVVERDFQFRISKGIGPLPSELSLKGDEFFETWLELFNGQGLGLRAFYTLLDEGIYSVAATSWDEYCRTFFMGTASHVDLRVALNQAILELVQQRSFTFFYEWKTRREYLPIVRYIKTRVPPERYTTSVPEDFWTNKCPGPIPLEDAGETFPGTLPDILDRLSAKHDVFAFDLTHPDLGVPVVRVLMTGMKNGYLFYRPVVTFDVGL